MAQTKTLGELIKEADVSKMETKFGNLSNAAWKSPRFIV